MANKVAVYPGSFNPWHEGHEDVLKKALAIFDKVIVLQYHNPKNPEVKDKSFMGIYQKFTRVEGGFFSGKLVDAVTDIKADAVIRGLRNGYDLDYEAKLQYWNEDLGLKVPVIYFLTDRRYTHISSTAVRELKALKAEEDKPND